MEMTFSRLAILLFCICLTAACQTSRQRVVGREDNLAVAGFLARPANTPEREAMLARLPAHKFVQHAKGDKIQYVYADPSVCKCLYVGSQAAYAKYVENKQSDQRIKELKRALKEHDNAAADDDFNAQVYDDPAWNWSAWGPWGPEYGYGPGLGW
jgi:hypothetical protein